MRWARRGFLVLGLALAACRESFNPMDPDAQLSLMVTVENTSGSATLLEATLVVDGHEVVRKLQQAGPVSSSFLIGSTYGKFSGTHELDVTIVQQVGSPHTYRATASVTLYTGSRGSQYGPAVGREATVAPQTASMETGGAFRFSFQF